MITTFKIELQSINKEISQYKVQAETKEQAIHKAVLEHFTLQPYSQMKMTKLETVK